jgi:3-oxoacyl-(acyl-carrier-protein) synthase
MYQAVITGLGPVAPNGVGKEQFWESIASGRTGIRCVDELVQSECPCHIAGNILPEWIEERSANLPDWLPDSKACRFSMIAAMLALEDAGLTPKDTADRKGAVYMGASSPDMEIYQREYQSFDNGGFIRPDALASAAPHASASAISHLLKMYTNIVTISTACTSGGTCIQYAADLINQGVADIVIAGGVDIPLSPFFISGCSSVGLVPLQYNHKPEYGSRPFDEQRESGVLSEGAGVVVLEEKTTAQRRKAKIYAEYSGGGTFTALSPSWMKNSFIAAMSESLNQSRLRPTDIDYISACAPGHPIIDQVETDAIKDLFGKRAYNIPVSSIKSMIGNPGAASGPLQVIAAALSIEHNYITPTVNLEKCSKDCDLDYIPLEGRVARINRVMINIRGFGGNTSSLVISRDKLREK